MKNINKNITETRSQKSEKGIVYHSMLGVQKLQLEGLFGGYSVKSRREKPLSLSDLYFLNSDGQISELLELMNSDLQLMRMKAVAGNQWITNLFIKYQVHTPQQLWDQLLEKSRCSAVIRYID